MSTETTNWFNRALAVAGFSLLAYLLIAGHQLPPTIAISILMFVLACAGIAQISGDMSPLFGGKGGG